MSKIRRMFTGGNTSKGFYSLHHNIISDDRNAIYILKGMPGGGKSSLMKDIGSKISDMEIDIEYHHCPSDASSIDALVIPKYKIAIVDGTPPHSMDPVYPGLTDKVIDLAKFIDKDKLIAKRESIIEAKRDNKKAYRKAFNYFRSAGNIYKEIESANNLLLDREGINSEIEKLNRKVFSKKELEIRSNGFKIRNLFSNANTPGGFIDYTDTLLENVEDVYYINGEIGTGISELMKFIVDKAGLLNYHIEIYRDCMIPEKIESIYIKDLDTMITSNKKGDRYRNDFIDLNKYIDRDKIDLDDYESYEMLIEKGTKSLGNAKKNHLILEKSYIPSVDYTGVDEIKIQISDEIMNIIKA